MDILTAAVDEYLNEHGYSTGSGDAGDSRLFGTKNSFK